MSRYVRLSMLLLVWALLVQGSRPAEAGESFSLTTPQIAQRFSPPEQSGRTKDGGAFNCLAASVAMLLQTDAVRSRLPAGAVTDYVAVRRRFRELTPDAGKGIPLDNAVTLLPELSNGALTASWGYPPLEAQAEFARTWQDYLRERLRTGLPVILDIRDWRKLEGLSGMSRQAHAIIVTGISDDLVVYNDPWDGRSHRMAAAKFAIAWSTPQPGTDYRWISLEAGWTPQARAVTSPSPSAIATVVKAAPQTPSRTPNTHIPTPTTTATRVFTPTAPAVERLAYRTPAGDMVLLDAATGAIEPLHSPAPDREYIVSADLSTFAWITPNRGTVTSGSGSPSVLAAPLTLHVERTVRGVANRSQINLTALLRGIPANRVDTQGLVVTLSPDGSRALVGPLSIGASGRMFGIVLLDTADGRVIDEALPPAGRDKLVRLLNWCALYEGAVAPDNAMIAGVTMENGIPGAGGTYITGGAVCSASARREDGTTAAALNAHLPKDASTDPRDFAWSADGRSVVFAQSPAWGRQGKESIMVVSAIGVRTLFALPDPPPVSGPRQQLASPSLSNDGRQLAFARQNVEGSGRPLTSEVWLMNAAGSGARKIADGSAPFWVRPVR